ncbi:type II toxin-antitoxin system PrlF family antitoxin [Rhodocyclus purpureus]|uniref:type II toxin-antitoxin system PrlF family antitoxin n=1 Tax=Rhodocyclus purpureus TaxID=1067 RepID=UPI001914AFCB|nr:type II toxin-antitoxin system PrlF family antitoxin [Rhodocyclus purpureus]MBK5914231.1 AbrB family transcriptional regulator [Rhodocyclus purpureus]
MHAIHEVATLTAKGQITLPKAIRQALGVDYGGKVAFDLLGSQVVVSRVEDEPHEDPAIGSFLALLEKDIHSGRHLGALPDDLARAMLVASGQPVDVGEDIEGDVTL